MNCRTVFITFTVPTLAEPVNLKRSVVKVIVCQSQTPKLSKIFAWQGTIGKCEYEGIILTTGLNGHGPDHGCRNRPHHHTAASIYPAPTSRNTLLLLSRYIPMHPHSHQTVQKSILKNRDDKYTPVQVSGSVYISLSYDGTVPIWRYESSLDVFSCHAFIYRTQTSIVWDLRKARSYFWLPCNGHCHLMIRREKDNTL